MIVIIDKIQKAKKTQENEKKAQENDENRKSEQIIEIIQVGEETKRLRETSEETKSCLENFKGTFAQTQFSRQTDVYVKLCYSSENLSMQEKPVHTSHIS